MQASKPRLSVHGDTPNLPRPTPARVVALFALLLAACQAPEVSGEAPASGSRFELFVLGVAQDGGLPHLGCERRCCATARAEGRVEGPACVGVHDRTSGKLVLIEATPRVESQIAHLHALSGESGRGRSPVDAVLLTHAHIGHYAGLVQFGREVAATDAIPLHVSARFAAFLRSNAPWSQLIELSQVHLVEFEPGSAFSPLPGLTVRAIPVPHRDEFSDTMAFRIEGPRRTVLFAPDVDSWSRSPGLLNELVEGVDVAYLDATFYDGRELPDRDLAEIPHPPMVDTMQRLNHQAREAPGRFRFLHLNHSNPVWIERELRESLQQRGFRIAAVGERVEL
jgi:pyrroloquinoline quinone biosynthesis protein B